MLLYMDSFELPKSEGQPPYTSMKRQCVDVEALVCRTESLVVLFSSVLAAVK